ncbi:4Fe-4S cluster-binding domain-containing protein [Blastochloris sulfoviridis]|uniref:Radical SAM protein n=1 Tax=Blastochloris sulfoviridis TaxID=50712 RepID=A0A5M6HSU3_9HYPH|nr:4Fe-4S cluster-binding domain-containing protein [Blastochloris sulfoviridis]KAA5598993.1 radical SAM protein [Blastochloris sulfoviridis]
MTAGALHLSRIHFPVRTLGFGARIGIWVQGCSIRCTGCISMDTWDPRPGKTTVEAVLAALDPWLHAADGITVSGGEPFDQPDALRLLLMALRARHAGDILVYSGYPLEALPLDRFDGLLDVLVAGPFDAGSGQTLALRGSDNQRLIPRTALGQSRYGPDVLAKGRTDTLEVMFDDQTGDVFLAGIPRRGDMRRLARILADAGHRAATTEDARHTP